MMSIPHCVTCRCEADKLCESKTTLLHETFECEKYENHDGWHRRSFLPAPCATCQGIELHADGCPDINVAVPDGDWQAILWHDLSPDIDAIIQPETDGEPDDLVLCEWFAMCDRIATTTVPHPVLGDVPTCPSCAEFAHG